MKKMLFLLLCGILVLSVTGCSQENKITENNTNQEEQIINNTNQEEQTVNNTAYAEDFKQGMTNYANSFVKNAVMTKYLSEESHGEQCYSVKDLPIEYSKESYDGSVYINEDFEIIYWLTYKGGSLETLGIKEKYLVIDGISEQDLNVSNVISSNKEVSTTCGK